MTYAEALAYIASLEPRGWRLGLDRMLEFVRRAELGGAVDGSEIQYIHVAGTNGKGSVTAFLQSLLVESSVRTGAFFSPYVVDIAERVQLGRDLISEAEMAELTASLKVVAESMEGTSFAGVTEFEFKTALAFMAWRRANTEWVALETGLGGRLDATNVVMPAASIIVSIGLDHQQILGDTLAKIAEEKAGIIKPGRPVIMGDLPREAARVIEAAAARAGANLWRYGCEIRWDGDSVETPIGSYTGLEPGLKGVWQGHNLALAVAGILAAGLKPTEAAVRLGAKRAFAPGRFQRLTWRGAELILDGAHNADSARALAQTLRQELGPDVAVTLLSNMLFGHEPEEFYGPLAPVTKLAIVPPIDFHRARNPDETAEAISNLGVPAIPLAALAPALHEAAKTKRPIVVTGSYYLVGDVARWLRANP